MGILGSAGMPGAWRGGLRGQRLALALRLVAVIAFVAFIAWSIRVCSQWNARADEYSARSRTAIDEFHRLYHAGDYLSIYDSSHPNLQLELTRHDALLRLSQAHDRLGSVVDMSFGCRTINSRWSIFRTEYRVIFENAEAWETYDWQFDGEETRLLAYAVETGFEDGKPDWEVVLAPSGVRPNDTTCAADEEQSHWWERKR